MNPKTKSTLTDLLCGATIIVVIAAIVATPLFLDLKHSKSAPKRLGVYLGMDAVYFPSEGIVRMSSHLTGEVLREVTPEDFRVIYVNHTKPEYGN